MYQRWKIVLLQKINVTSLLRIIINIVALLQPTGVIDYFKWLCLFEETTIMEKKTATHKEEEKCMAAFGTYYLFYLIYSPGRAEFPNKILFHHYRFNI